MNFTEGNLSKTIEAYHALVIAFVEAMIAKETTAQPRPAACHRRLYGGCCGAGSRDDCDDAGGHRVPAVHVMSCTFDSASTCHHPMSAAMTSASCDLNCETKDLLKLDICLRMFAQTIKISEIIALMISGGLRGQREEIHVSRE